jgi:hypothetical protein
MACVVEIIGTSMADISVVVPRGREGNRFPVSVTEFEGMEVLVSRNIRVNSIAIIKGSPYKMSVGNLIQIATATYEAFDELMTIMFSHQE